MFFSVKSLDSSVLSSSLSKSTSWFIFSGFSSVFISSWTEKSLDVSVLLSSFSELLVTAFPSFFCVDASSDERATLSIISQETSGWRFIVIFSYVRFLIEPLMEYP